MALLNDIANGANQYINSVYAYGNTGSAMANAASAGAQRAQFNFNAGEADRTYQRQLELANQQAAFNSGQAAMSNQWTKEYWEKAADYNAQQAEIARDASISAAEKAMQFNALEAEKARQWQEMMSNTAYQRAVADMKAAGINPILAAVNGGANVGSGAAASIGGINAGGTAASMMPSSGQMASVSQAGAPQASGSNYTGQGNNMSENLAMIGAMASMFGNAVSGLGEAFNLSKVVDSLGNWFKDIQDDKNLNAALKTASSMAKKDASYRAVENAISNKIKAKNNIKTIDLKSLDLYH